MCGQNVCLCGQKLGSVRKILPVPCGAGINNKGKPSDKGTREEKRKDQKSKQNTNPKVHDAQWGSPKRRKH